MADVMTRCFGYRLNMTNGGATLVALVARNSRLCAVKTAPPLMFLLSLRALAKQSNVFECSLGILCLLIATRLAPLAMTNS